MIVINTNNVLQDLDRFGVEYFFSFILTSKTPISIGGGGDLFGLDNAVVRLRGRPYIPGSSLKGVLRSQAERITRSIYGEEAVCSILNPETEKSRKASNGDSYRPCIVCSIFGGPTIASRTKVYNAEIKDVDNGRGRRLTNVIRRVSIDRITGAQAKGRLFDVEYIVPELEFEWFISIRNIELLERTEDPYFSRTVDIVNYLIRGILTEGIEVGGKRSVGFGFLQVKKGGFSVEERRIQHTDKGIVLQRTDVTQKYMVMLGLD